MAIDLCITNRKTNECEFILVCSADQYRTLWRPAIEALDLPMLDCLPGLEVTSEFKGQFIAELSQLKMWATNQKKDSYISRMVETVDNVLKIVESTSFEDYEVSFG